MYIQCLYKHIVKFIDLQICSFFVIPSSIDHILLNNLFFKLNNQIKINVSLDFQFVPTNHSMFQLLDITHPSKLCIALLFHLLKKKLPQLFSPILSPPCHPQYPKHDLSSQPNFHAITLFGQINLILPPLSSWSTVLTKLAQNLYCLIVIRVPHKMRDS